MSHQVHIDGSDVGFGCAPGQTVLEAALANRIQLPYSCMRGVCSSCLGEVLGPAAEAQPQLLCQYRPSHDIIIRPSWWSHSDSPGPKVVAVKVHRNEQVTPDINILQLRLPIGQREKFRPGQYLRIILPDGQRRSYSIANAPHQNDAFALHVRHVKGGLFTGMLPSLAAGNALEVELPFGNVELPKDSTGPLLCVAGGTGFAPVKSLIDHLVYSKDSRPVDLVWGARRPADLYLMAAIGTWQRKLPNFRFFPAIEQPDEQAPPLSGATAGRVDDAILALYPSLAQHEVYCCGAPAMVEAVRKLCVGSLGLQEGDFFADPFYSAAV